MPVSRDSGRPRSGARDLLARTYSLRVEMAILAAVVLLWQLLRIPLVGSVPEALAHAHD